jgi:hypothetical protein
MDAVLLLPVPVAGAWFALLWGGDGDDDSSTANPINLKSC